MEGAENSIETAKVIGRPFPKGVSGNPGGRPKNSLKGFMKERFALMTDEEKAVWLKEHKVSGEVQWRMAEGNPAQDIDLSGEITSKIVKLDE